MNAGARAIEVAVNGRVYQTPTRPPRAIPTDGCEPSYLDDALARGLMPHLGSRLNEQRGAYWRGLAHMPTLTNPNNTSIVTGVAPAEHGISGNHCLIESSTE